MIVASVSSFAAEETFAADVFKLKSSTFDDGKIMPKKVANSAANSQNNPNYVGDNVSPEFSWSNVPEGTKSFVMLMTDPEGRGGAGDLHRPGLEPRPLVGAGQHDLGRFVEHDPHHLISAA